MRILQGFKNNTLVLLILIFLIGSFYGSSLRHDFVHDDMGQVVDNEYVHSLKYLPKVITGCIWESAMGGCYARSDYYRPMQSLSYLLTYQISKEAWFFHFVNLLYFLIAAFLVFILAREITGNYLFSLLASVLFIINPVNNEAVNWISAVPDLLFAIFSLLAVIYYFRHRKSPSSRYLFFVYLFYFLGMLSKEPAILLPAVLLTIDIVFFKIKFFNIRKPDLLKNNSEGGNSVAEKDKTDIILDVSWKELKKYFVFCFLFLVYIFMRISVLGWLGNSKSYYFGEFTVSEKVYAFFTLFQQYFFKIIYPNYLNFFYDFERRSDFFNFEFIFSFALFIFLAFVFYFLVAKGRKLFALSLAWFFVFIFPVIFFLGSVGENVFSERYLFVPGIGLALVVSAIFVHLFERKQIPRPVLLLAIAGLIVYSWFVVGARNQYWKNNETLYLYTLKQNPDARPVRYNLSVIYKQNGDLEKAREGWEILEKRNSDWPEISSAYNNLGDYYRIKGNSDKAFEYFSKAAEAGKRSGNSKGYNNLGSFYLEKGDYLGAIFNFCRAIEMNPEAKGTQESFEMLVHMIESLDEEDLPGFYGDLTKGKVFQKSDEEKMNYLGSSCAEDKCKYEFIFNSEEKETVLSFLIIAHTASGEILRPVKYDFDEQSRKINFELSPENKGEDISFLVPTCGGIYYDARTSSSGSIFKTKF